jgi:hypothetical protein
MVEEGSTTILEARLDRDEDRIALDEARLAADEHLLRSNRRMAWIAIGLGIALVLAVTGLVIAVIAVNRDIDVVARAAPKNDSVGTAALQANAVTADKVATGAIGSRQLADNSVTRADVAHNGLTGTQIDESTLAEVPTAHRASRASSAADADKLAGAGASVYLSRLSVQHTATAMDGQTTKGPLGVHCPRGKRLVGGGAAVAGAAHGIAIVDSAPRGQDWVATAVASARVKAPWRLEVTAICAAGGG